MKVRQSSDHEIGNSLGNKVIVCVSASCRASKQHLRNSILAFFGYTIMTDIRKTRHKLLI